MAEKLNIYELDKFDPNDFFIPLNFSVADFRDISTRNGYYSKTVEIPSTKKNDSLLGQSFDISAEGFFDRNKKQKAFIERDGIVYLDGFMQLKSVELRNGKPYLYKIVLFSNLAEWASEMGDATIQEIDYSTIEYTPANVEASWSNNGLEDEYVFPAINYENLTGVDSTDNIQVEDFLPSVFVYYILRKSFANIGYQLKPGIFADKRFHNLILPWCVSSVSASEEFLNDNDGGVSLGLRGARDTQPYTNTSTYNWQFERYVPGSNTDNFNFDGGIFLAPFDCTINCNFTGKVFNGQTLFSNDVDVKITKISDGGATVETVTNQVKTIEKYDTQEYDLEADNISLLQGDSVRVQFTPGNSNSKLAFSRAFFNVAITSAPLSNGDNIGVGDNLPEIKQIDLVKAMVQMFNLYHVTDERGKTVEFFTRDEFYKGISDADNWTENVDYSKKIEIEQLQRNLNLDLQFEYIYDDNDDLQVGFKNDYGITYGNYTERLDNEFLRDEKKVADIPFAPSIGSGTIEQTDGSTIPLPWIKTNYNGSGLVAGIGDGIDVQDRILIYDGLVDWNWTFETVSKTQIPFSYFTKLDSDFSDVSLSFRSYKDFNKAIRANDRGLFERFYKNQIRMFNESRLVTMYLKLSPVDILNLDFRKPKYIDGNYYYLNKIEDYKTGTDETVKVELINIP